MSKFVAMFLPGSSASAKEIRISGILIALPSAFLGIAIGHLSTFQQPPLSYLVGLPFLIIWFVGIHKAIWGGKKPVSLLGRFGQLIGSFALGYLALFAVGVIVVSIERIVTNGGQL